MKLIKPVLLIMAAGLGSRYGGLKQIDPVGPHGEILLEFALMDAIAIGIERVVIIVSETTKPEFESIIVEKYREKITIELVVQCVEKIPSLWTLNLELWTWALARTKPWWTAHAIWCAREAITGPFVVINADDFYGRDALKQAYDFLLKTNEWNQLNESNVLNNHCIITYPITSTLSNYGTVSRWICEVHDGKLVKIVEHTKVEWKNNEWNQLNANHRLVHTAEDGHEVPVPEDAPANMNIFGFQHSFFEVLDRECQKFFAAYIHEPKREFFLPSVVMEMIRENAGTVTALSTTSNWFGMTNPEDRAEAKNKIQALIASWEYI